MGAVTGNPIVQVQFQAHLDLLRVFLTHREGIVERIEDSLNAQRKPVSYLQDRSLLARLFEDCFFAHPAVTAGQRRLRGQLEDAYSAGRFRPRPLQGMQNDLIHPVEMMMRGFHFWQQTRWPGRNGRVHYAHTLFNVYVLRCLELLSLQLWDESFGNEQPGNAGGRLAEMQTVLAELWRSSPAEQPAIVRDARWLIPLAQSQPTDDLAAYLELTRQVSETLPEADALEVQKAHVRMLGGHLTSQIRHLCTKEGVPIDDRSVVLRTRTSNALDFALLIQGLVALLKAYDCAIRGGDERMRLDMAGAICQGISPDPDLFLNRVDLLSAYSMIEHVFIATDSEDRVGYSLLGQRHVQLLNEYGTLIRRMAKPLRDDLPRFQPMEGGYSPYGVVFGYPSTLTELMALKTLQRDAETRFSLEDAFVDDAFHDEETSAAKLAWVDGWRKMPHISAEVQRMYDYPQQFAEEIYNRIESALNAEVTAGSRTGRLYIVSGIEINTGSNAAVVPELPARYFASSDKQLVAAHQAELYESTRLLFERQEAHFLVTFETQGGWVALRKDLLTEVLGVGRDARIAALPPAGAEALRLMCRGLVMPEEEADRANVPLSTEKA